ncbi:unnamed protein product [Bursaphelenchus okinawaensis]|uniref:Chromo domain-containing protein n=1 Tax=Bursaphelenchus okinawaensis TaxID=465554 RepID=A0A811LNS9_9BILA|nr:unnamed protein product [Bursaphelenchus okinawaensis]CAG9125058.1 unnamed protein product [Bursaphelenchus okinawaensis]
MSDVPKVYEVEAILKDRVVKGEKEYFVKWKGFDSKDNTWEPIDSLFQCQRLLKVYKLKKEEEKEREREKKEKDRDEEEEKREKQRAKVKKMVESPSTSIRHHPLVTQ